MTHICIGKLTSIGSDNGLSPGRRQVIIWTNAWILFIGPLGTNFSEFLNKILKFSFMKMRLKVSYAKWRPFYLGLNVLNSRFALCCVMQLLGSGRVYPYPSGLLNTLRPRQNGRHFAGDTFKRIFLKKNVRISVKISLKFVPKSSIDNIPALFQIMAWRRPGDKPLSEAMMASLYMCRSASMS